jgi:hypothetical protein
LTSISLTFLTAASRAGRATAKSESASPLILLTSASYVAASASSIVTTFLISSASVDSFSIIFLVLSTSI